MNHAEGARNGTLLLCTGAALLDRTPAVAFPLSEGGVVCAGWGSVRRRLPAGMGECLAHDLPLAVEARQREEVSE